MIHKFHSPSPSHLPSFPITCCTCVLTHSSPAAAANDLIFKGPFDKMIPIYSSRLQTTAVKVLVATIQYKHTMTDAELGYFRSTLQHKEDSALWAAHRLKVRVIVDLKPLSALGTDTYLHRMMSQ